MSKRKKLTLLVVFVAALFFLGRPEKNIRIVSLSTTHSEILLELRAHNYLVGVDKHVSNGRLKGIKRIDSYITNTNEILSLSPTHVIIAFENRQLEKDLFSTEIELILLPPAKNLDEVYSQIFFVSKMVNKEREAQNIVEKMKKKNLEVISMVKPSGKRIYHELGYSYGIYSLNENSLLGSFYRELGFVNIVNEINNQDQYPKIEESLIIEKDPELIIVGHKESFGSRLENRPNWSNISAVKNEKIIYLEENLANNWGTSSVDLLEELAIQTGAIEKEENNTKQTFYWWFYIVVIISSVLIMNSRTRKTKEYS